MSDVAEGLLREALESRTPLQGDEPEGGLAGQLLRAATGSPTPRKEPPQSDTSLASQAGQGLIEGVSAIVGAPGDILSFGERLVTGQNRVFRGSEALESGFRQALGLEDAEPQTTAQRFVRNLGVETGAAALPTAGLAGAAVRAGRNLPRAADSLFQSIARPFRTAPVATGAAEAAAITGAAGGVTAGEALDSVPAQIVGGIAGAAAGPAALGTATRMVRRLPASRAEATQVAEPSQERPVIDSGASEVRPDNQADFPGAPIPELEPGDFAGNINLRNIGPSDPQARGVMKMVAAENDAFMEARRGVISNEETLRLATERVADDVGMTPEELLRRRQGQAFNAEEMTQARLNLAGSLDNTVEAARRAIQDNSDENLARLKVALTNHAAIQEQISGATAEAGRALQAMRILARGQTAREQMMKDLLDSPGLFSPEDEFRLAAGDERSRLEEMAKAIDSLDDPNAQHRLIAKSKKPRFRDQVFEAWVNGLLSGPQTHATNILSNTAMQLWTIPEHATAALLGSLTRKPGRVYMEEVPARVAGFVKGAKDGIKMAAKTLVTGEPSDPRVKIEQAQRRAIPGPLGEVVRTPGRFLMAEDEFFKAMGRRMEMHGLAARQASDEGLFGRVHAQRVNELMDNPTEEMLEKSKLAGEILTFTNKLGRAGNAWLNFRRDVPGMAVVMPFVRTPVNLIAAATRRTPLSPILGDVRRDLRGKNGQAAKNLAQARIIMGSAAMGVLAQYALDGKITGSPPKDPAVRSVWRLNGIQPWSVKVGDQWYSYQRLEPFSMMLGTAADMALISQAWTRKEEEDVAGRAVFAMSQNILNRTWTTGLRDLIHALDDPERFGQRYINRLTASAVPAIVAQGTRTMDPVLRDVEGPMDAIKQRVPGWSDTLPARRDIFGEPITTEGSLGPDFISPIWLTTQNKDPAAIALMESGFKPGKLQENIRGAPLTTEEFSQLSEVTGKMFKRRADIIIRLPNFRNVPDFAKRKLFKQALDKSREDGRQFMIARNPELRQRIVEALRKRATE